MSIEVLLSRSLEWSPRSYSPEFLEYFRRRTGRRLSERELFLITLPLNDAAAYIMTSPEMVYVTGDAFSLKHRYSYVTAYRCLLGQLIETEGVYNETDKRSAKESV